MKLAVNICGVDEAGRGPLAGPVFAAAVILDADRQVRGLKDSKLLTPERREVLASRIVERAVAYAIAHATVEEIDRVTPDEAWIDGNRCPELPCRARAIVEGDRLHKVISAASILAKTARDAEMRRMHERYPVYGFDRHKGYGTPAHLEMLERHGPCEIHRRSFMPVQRKLDLG
jgi:ribonuclease HII